MNRIKRLLTENWLPKLLCLLLAIGIWVVVRQHNTNRADSSPYNPEIRRSVP